MRDFDDMAPRYEPLPVILFGAGQTIRTRRTLVSINNTATDVATFTGFPSKYLVSAMRVYDSSADLSVSLATLGLYTGAGATGPGVVIAATMTGLTAPEKVLPMTIAVPDVLTAPTLYLHNGVPHGGAATVTVQLEIIDLS